MNVAKRNNMIFPALMNEIFNPDWFGGIEKVGVKIPPVNIASNETGFELELIVPGIRKEDLNIEIDADVLTVSVEVKNTSAEGDKEYTRREFSLSRFSRSFTLPETVNTEKIEVNYEDGILAFRLPKKEEALPKPKRVIELK